jgi:hypothetical protein
MGQSIEAVVLEVSGIFGIDPGQVKSKCREGNVVKARKMTYLICRYLRYFPNPLAEHFGQSQTSVRMSTYDMALEVQLYQDLKEKAINICLRAGIDRRDFFQFCRRLQSN